MAQDSEEHRITAVDEEGNKVDEPVLINGENPLVGGSGGAFADTDGDGDAELQSENTDYQGGDAKNVGALDADELFSNSLTMYVRSDGSDSNDGLSSSNAKATIQSALSDAPIPGAQDKPLVIDLGGSTFSEEVDLRGYQLSTIKFAGAGESSTTIDASSTAGFGLLVEGQNIELTDLTIIGGGTAALAAINGSYVDCTNTTLQDGGAATVRCYQSSLDIENT